MADNREVIVEAGLQEHHISSDAVFADLLMHGYLDHHDDPTEFKVDQLDQPQYAAFRKLVVRYFEAGYPYFTVMALRTVGEQRQLESRFSGA